MGWLKDTIKKAEGGTIFGDSVWGRYASNVSGATTSARLIRRGLNGELIEPNDVIDDARVMRPTMGYSAANNAIAGEAADAQNLILSQQKAALDQQQTVEERSKAFRAARRKQLAAANASSSATTLTGPSGLGDSSGGTAKTLLGA